MRTSIKCEQRNLHCVEDHPLRLFLHLQQHYNDMNRLCIIVNDKLSDVINLVKFYVTINSRLAYLRKWYGTQIAQ